MDKEGPEPAFIVVDDARRPLGSVVGRPPSDLIREAVGGVAELLAFPENIEHVSLALPDWNAEQAILHSLRGRPAFPPKPGHPTRYLERGEVAELRRVESELLAELEEADEEGVEIVVATAEQGLPVAFCYAGAETEGLWDIAIDTLRSHRRRGYAQAAATRLITDQTQRGLDPVWGAVESNEASLSLARKLGFQAVDAIWLLTRS